MVERTGEHRGKGTLFGFAFQFGDLGFEFGAQGFVVEFGKFGQVTRLTVEGIPRLHFGAQAGDDLHRPLGGCGVVPKIRLPNLFFKLRQLIPFSRQVKDAPIIVEWFRLRHSIVVISPACLLLGFWKDSVHKGFGVEGREVFGSFAQTDEQDRQVEFAPDGERHSAFCGGIEFG